MGQVDCSEQGRRPVLHPSEAQTSSPHPPGEQPVANCVSEGSGASGCSRSCSRRQTSLMPTGRNPSGHRAGAAGVPAGDGPAPGRRRNVPGGAPSTEAAFAGGGLRVGVQQDEPTSPLCLPSAYIQTSSEGAVALHGAPLQFLRKENQRRFCKGHKRFLLLFQTLSYPKFLRSTFLVEISGFIESERTNGDPCSPCPTPHLPGDRPHQPKASALSPRPAARDADLLQTGQLARGDRAVGSREAEPCVGHTATPVCEQGLLTEHTHSKVLFKTEMLSQNCESVKRQNTALGKTESKNTSHS